MKSTVWFQRINLPRHVCDHLFGERHGALHQMVAGVCVMACGVAIAKHAGHSGSEFVEFFGDALGYGVHGLGLAPFIEHLMKAQE